ncbi:MAG: DUF438 domain-containing protein [Deltaproteobacteria bacterium]|nr:DUF438 domain-containing protein [Deltaproteobacteria bacterium]
MQISADTKIHDLITEYPELLEFLVGYAEEFKKLRNPILRNTIGRVASIKEAAALANFSTDKLLADVVAEVARIDGLRGKAPAPAINDRAARVAAMKSIIRDLHAGADKDALKARFALLLKGLDPSEIGTMEQELVAEGLPVEEIKRMCEVHVEMFKEALAKGGGVAAGPGHPVHGFIAENRRLGEAADRIESAVKSLGAPPDQKAFHARRPELLDLYETLGTVEFHYRRKENQIFPLMEKRGFAAPTQVMWGVHDEIRARLKATRQAIIGGDAAGLVARTPELLQAIRDMFFKEEKILFPMVLDVLTKDEWERIARGGADLGYSAGYRPPITAAAARAPVRAAGDGAGILNLDTGSITPEQINLILKALPLDVTFVDENDEVRYYTAGRERIFPRSPEVIGRKVQNCHPPKSLHKVNEILDGFRDGSRNSAEFWINFGGRFVHIRYFALRDKRGAYRGCIEVTQDVTEIRHIEGQKRLLD